MIWKETKKTFREIGNGIHNDKGLFRLTLIGLLICISTFIFQNLKPTDLSIGSITLEQISWDKFTIWELASMAWIPFFTAYYIGHIKILGESINTSIDSLFIGAFVFFVPILNIFAILFHSTIWHFIFEFFIIATFIRTDISLSIKLSSYGRNLIKHNKNSEKGKKAIEDAREYLIITKVLNIPLAVAFTIFFIWFLFNSYYYNEDINKIRVFISGYTATIFIVLNIVFIIIQSGALRSQTIIECDE